MALVTLEQAKLRMRLLTEDTFYDDDLTMKIEQATEIVIDFIEQPDHEWTAEDAPANIQAAILEVVKNLFEGEEAPLSAAVKDLLRRYRDPAVA